MKKILAFALMGILCLSCSKEEEEPANELVGTTWRYEGRSTYPANHTYTITYKFIDGAEAERTYKSEYTDGVHEDEERTYTYQYQYDYPNLMFTRYDEKGDLYRDKFEFVSRYQFNEVVTGSSTPKEFYKQ